MVTLDLQLGWWRDSGAPGSQGPPSPPPVTLAGPAHVAWGGCMYLQSLQPRVVGVHQPGPLWGAQGCGQPGAVTSHPTPAAPGSSPPPTPAPLEPGPEAPWASYLPASSLPPQTRTGGQTRGPCTGGKSKSHPQDRPQLAVRSASAAATQTLGPNSTRQPAPALARGNISPRSTPLAHRHHLGKEGLPPSPVPSAASLWRGRGLGCSV